MSDYQRITVRAVEPKAVTIEVVENASSSALSSLFDRRSERADWLKIGAQLLLDEKARAGDVEAPEDEEPEPDQYVADVSKIEATEVGRGEADCPIYRAVLRIALKKAKHAKLFEVGDTFGAVAHLGGDFSDMFS